MWDKFEDFVARVLNIEKSCTTIFLHAADADKIIAKGGFYSKGNDVFVIFSNRRTLSNSWAWILEILKGSHYVN